MVHTLTLSLMLVVAAPVPATKIELTDQEQAAVDALKKVGFQMPPDKEFDFPGGTVLRYRGQPSKGAPLEEQLAPLAELRRLRRLELSGVAVTNKTMTWVKDMPDLEFLWLTTGSVDDEGVKKLANCKKLKGFWYGYAGLVTDDGLQTLAEIPGLCDLMLERSKITNTGLKALEGNERLVTLGLGNNEGISDDGMASLGKIPNLISLSLAGDRITNNGLALLTKSGGCPKLRGLNLANTAVSDEGLKLLHDGKVFPALRHIDLPKKSVSPEAVEKLKQARPDLVVNQ